MSSPPRRSPRSKKPPKTSALPAPLLAQTASTLRKVQLNKLKNYVHKALNQRPLSILPPGELFPEKSPLPEAGYLLGNRIVYEVVWKVSGPPKDIFTHAMDNMLGYAKNPRQTSANVDPGDDMLLGSHSHREPMAMNMQFRDQLSEVEYDWEEMDRELDELVLDDK